MNNTYHVYFRRFFNLVTSSTFWGLTFVCNLFIILSSTLFFLLEHKANDQISEVIDAIWWAFATVTTVGYGDITPITLPGRILGILMMLGGTALFATYTALFANALLGHEFRRLGTKVANVQHEIELEDENIHKTINRLQASISDLQKRLDKDDK